MDQENPDDSQKIAQEVVVLRLGESVWESAFHLAWRSPRTRRMLDPVTPGFPEREAPRVARRHADRSRRRSFRELRNTPMAPPSSYEASIYRDRVTLLHEAATENRAHSVDP